MRIAPLWVVLLIACGTATAAQSAGQATIPGGPSQSGFGNAEIVASWKLEDGTLSDLVVTDRRHDASIQITGPFSLTFKDGSTLAASNFRLQGGLREVALAANPKAPRLVERFRGKAVEGRLLGPQGHVRIDWKLV
ncbi:MAG: enterotoxin, partial [Rhodanobacteraceae bacterium]